MLKYLVVGEILLFLVMNKKNKGFTLTETLLTITILVILFALAVPGVFTIKKNLRQMELDDKAEIIYTAVQNRLTELYTSGLSNYYDPSANGDVTYYLNGIPADYVPNYDEDDGVDRNIDFYYFKSSDLDKLGNLLGNNTIDDSLKNGHFVVEYLPYAVRTDENKTLTVPFVYAVYYSEDEVDVSQDYGANSAYLNTYRAKQNRLHADARIGYYGGTTPGSGSITKSVTINSVKIYSEEEINRAVVKGRIGAGVDDTKVTFTFEFSDQHGGNMTYYYIPSPSINKFYVLKNGAKVEVDRDICKIKVSNIGNNYTFNFVLDDLSSDSTRFKTLYKDLKAGDDITLRAICTSEEGTVFKDEGSDIGNSIYAYVKDKDANYNIYISNGRHLQNLDKNSNVISAYTKAILLNDIDFSNTGNFYSTYKNSYFNGFMSIYKINDNGTISTLNVPKFKGIINNDLIILDGKTTSKNEMGITVESLNTIKELSTNTGLFDSVSNSNLTIKNISLTGERVYGNDVAGGLVATVSNDGELNAENCKIYLVSNVDIPTTIKPEYYLESIRWIYGKTSGGLVGINNGTLNIGSSFVATNVGSSDEDTITGGLVGNNLGNLNIDKSYADCYLYGSTVSGIACNNEFKPFSLTNSYSAGFILTEENNGTAAGLVCGGAATINNTYTVIYKGLLDYGRNANGVAGFYGAKGTDLNDTSTYFATVGLAGTTFNNVYFKQKGSNGTTDYGAQRDSFSVGDLDASVFSLKGVSHRYMMMGASLTSYNYPKLINMDHYGDWAAGFVAGSLVYYEKYTDGKYGFDGANVAISLTAEKQIAGDGYGVVFKTEDIENLDDSFTVTINGNIKTINFNSDSYPSGIYSIYPLSSVDVNPDGAISNFYEKCEIKYGVNALNFYFNPHFGRSVVESDELPSKVQGDIVYVRSPRQLNNLSLYFNDYRNILGSNITYKQERNMNYNPNVYEWNTFGKDGKIVSTQGPIGADFNNSFNATYDGGCFEINNVNFKTESGTYVGLFGYNDGTLKNIVVATQYAKDKTSYHVQRKDAVGDNQEAYFGVLAGYNNGKIDNCAIAGYYLSGSDGKIHGYRNSKIYIGGLVGYNSIDGKISNSASDLPKLSLAMNSSTCYAGAFVGFNEGSINNTYGISLIESNAQTGDTKIAGFAGYNTGSINNSYCATALVSSGEGSSTFNFTPKEGGGYVYNSYFLNGSSFKYIDDLYAYSGNTHLSSATPKTYSELSKLRGTNVAVESKYHNLTTELNYPYRAIVKNNNGQFVHYGEWQVKPELGVLGVFYWEHEENGQNNGYKITYIGSSNGVINFGTNLCNEHDDSGVITEYGYGYYCGEDDKDKIEITNTNNLTFSGKDNYNLEVQKALESQIPNIKFYPYTTTLNTDEDYIYLDTNKDANGDFWLKLDGKEYKFTISPFFANALSFETDLNTENNDAKKFMNNKPGFGVNPYEVRSIDQLQYINYRWSSSSSIDTDSLGNRNNRTEFPYLMYSDDNGNTKYGSSFDFKQTHDIDASDTKQLNPGDEYRKFVPIAGQETVNNGYSHGVESNGKIDTYTSSYVYFLSTWFGGSFDGQSYKIQELNIKSNSYTVGMFGVTCGGDIKNIILYSSEDATIERNTNYDDFATAYALGGIVGVAYDFNGDLGKSISNCAIAGYRIVDNSKNPQIQGEACTGGLVGISRIKIESCSAVVDVVINCIHRNSSGLFTKATWGNYVRVGGISGACLGSISDSYTGGSMAVGTESFDGWNILDECYDSYGNMYPADNSKSGTAKKNYSTNIYLSGITGSGFCMNFQNITKLDNVSASNPTVENCYTYMSFPSMQGTIRSITMFASLADRFGNGEKDDNGNLRHAIIKNSYYLDSSKNFDTSNLPKFIIDDGGANQSPYSIMSDEFKKYMIDGSTLWLLKIHKPNDGLYNQFQTIDASIESKPKTFEQLSSNEMNGLLNSAKFDDVTITDESDVIVNGKYSFSAGNLALEGKNYPFPTVIRQYENGRKVNVHYGEWPFISAHFENGSDTIDIFNNMNDENIATKTFTLIGYNKVLDDIAFRVEKPEYAEIIEQKQVDGNYVITVKALKTGATDIIATWKENKIDYEANFNLNITAKLVLNIEPNNIYLNSGDKPYSYSLGVNATNSYIQVLSSDGTKDYSNKVNWKFVSSKVGVDTEETDAFEPTNTATKLNITSAGYNGSVAVTATYNYLGNDYSVSSNIDISTNYLVGLKGDGDVYNESILKDATFSAVSNKNYGTTTGPVNESTYFVYERNEKNDDGVKDLIGNITSDKLSLSPLAGSTITQATLDNIQISLGEINTNSTTNNDYNSRSITFVYKSIIEQEIKCNLTVKVEKDSSSVDLTVPVTIKSQPYTLTLDANGGTLEGLASKEIKLNSSQSIDLSVYSPQREGYTFDDWYDENDEVVSSPYTPSTDLNNDVIFKAKWKPLSGVINFNNGLAGTEAIEHAINCDFDSTNINNLPTDLTDNNYHLIGYFDNENELIVKPNGDVNKEKFNAYLLDNINNGTSIVLTAQWEKATLSLKAISLDGNAEGDLLKMPEFNKGYSLNHIDLPSISTNDNYSFIGFGYKDGTVLVNSEGNFIDADGNDINFAINEDTELFALFNAKGFAITNEFKDNNNYLLVSNGLALSRNGDYSNGYYRNAISINGYLVDDVTSYYMNGIDSNLIWTANGINNVVSIKNNNEYLNGYSERYLIWVTNNLNLSTSSQLWNYSNNKYLIKDNYPIILNNDKFKYSNSSTGSAFDLYEYREDIRVYKYKSANSGGLE